MSPLAKFWLRCFERQGELGAYWPSLERIAPDQHADRLAVAELERAGYIREATRFENGSNFQLAPLKTAAALRVQDLAEHNAYPAGRWTQRHD